jgi:vancomycin resistance protein YoaR
MNSRRIVTVAAVALVALLGIATAAFAGLRLAHRGEVLPGITVAGVDVSGMDEDEARAALLPTVRAREADPVTLTFEDHRFTLQPERIGYAIDLGATLEGAMTPGRTGALTDETWRHVAAYWQDRDLDLAVTYDASALGSWVDDVAADVDRDPFPGAVSADPETLEVSSQPPADGADVDEVATADTLLAALGADGPDEVELPVEILPTRIEPGAVAAVADRAARALEAPLQLTSSPRDVTLQPSDLAQLISLTEREIGDDEWTVELDVTPGEVETLFADITGDFEVAPVDARFDVPRTPSVTFDDMDDATWRPRSVDVPVVPSEDGLTLDPALAAAQMSQLLREGVREAPLRLAEVEPAFATADARDLDIDTLLSTFTSYHACCQTRVANIQRLADMVDGTVIAPGEQFSVNQISGERTCSKGFAPAGMILRGEIVDVCGGGVSQFGTTTINAVFFAGIDPDAYKPHSFYISRYPMGREATLNYPSPDIDVKFTNDTGNGILVRAGYTPTSVTVSFYGNNDVERVSAIHGQPSNTKPYPTEYRENKDLAPQSARTIQSGRNGFSVGVTREIEYADGETVRDDWSNVYVPEREIIERNTDPAPEPSPTPSPSPDREPSPRPSGSPKPTPPPPDDDRNGGQNDARDGG